MSDWAGTRVTVMGLGAFGGGVGVARYLAGLGANVLVTDTKPAASLAASVDALRDLIDAGRVSLRLGEHRESDFTHTDVVIANPAVPKPWDNVYLNAAERAGVRITTEIALSVAGLPDRSRVVAITGSAGKSTTSAMIHHALTNLGHAAVFGGNIGGSLLARSIPRETYVVLELSSFMLYWLARDRFAPRVAVVTNLSPNHLDWHGTMDHYRQSKQALLANQHPGDTAVLGPGVADWPLRPGVTLVRVPESAGVADLAIPGRHNALNAAMAVEAVLALLDHASPSRAVEQTLRTFGGLAHRLRLVGTFAGVRCFNDSKSTTPESALLALEAIAERTPLNRVHLIAGGYDKGSNLTPVAQMASQLAGLYTIGQTGPALDAASRGASTPCGTLDAAVAAAFANARPGDVLLLSPACASWGQFENFERRGEHFERLVAARGATP